MFIPSKQVLSFETLAITTQDGEDKLDRTKLKQLAKLFRPDSEGNIGILDFVKSCDGVYKEVNRLLRSIILLSASGGLANFSGTSYVDSAFGGGDREFRSAR